MACADCDDCPFTDDRQDGEYHEIHISVPFEQKSLFETFCSERNVKGLSVNFIDTDGNEQTHVMTAHIIKGDKWDAMNVMGAIKDAMVGRGLSVERLKIESSNLKRAFSNDYYERHVRYEVEDSDLDKFLYIVTGNEIKISYNNKHKGNTPLLTMKTKPGGETLEEFNIRFSTFENKMLDNGFKPVKTMLERCWYDNNYAYDDVWSFV